MRRDTCASLIIQSLNIKTWKTFWGFTIILQFFGTLLCASLNNQSLKLIKWWHFLGLRERKKTFIKSNAVGWHEAMLMLLVLRFEQMLVKCELMLLKRQMNSQIKIKTFFCFLQNVKKGHWNSILSFNYLKNVFMFVSFTTILC